MALGINRRHRYGLVMKAEKIWRKRTHDNEFAARLAQELDISPVLAQILATRKLDCMLMVEEFLEPNLKNLSEPFRFCDMEKAVLRIVAAIKAHERIGIFGDYDVDGVTSTAVLQEFLSNVGASVVSTLPHRMTEGYGLSRPGIERLHAQVSSLLITVDCGITAHDNVDYAKSLGFDVIIVDHHSVGETLPAALAVINPKRSDCSSNASYLCAAGIAFFVCIAVRRALREQNYFVDRPEPDLKNSLDLVALATVCDVVPLVKDNRVLVKAGLRTIKYGQRVGMRALIEAAGVDQQKISSTNLGFHLGPRINAAGRLEDATHALKLLLAPDSTTARTFALALDDKNQERRYIEEETVKAASAIIDSDAQFKDARALVVHDETWHPGVVGIVASRIAERYHRPAIIIGEKGKGSGRSIKGIDLHAMVSKASSSLRGFGGHAHAIGVTLGDDGVAPFRNDLLAVMATDVAAGVFIPELLYDVDVALGALTFQLVDDLARLEPFGAANPSPIVRVNKTYLRNLRRLDGGHLKGELEAKDGVISFIGFRMDIPDELAQCALDVLGVVEKNEWQGRVSLQLRLIDYKKSPSG